MINYYLLTKPGIIFGNLITFAAGFLLASRGIFYGGLFVAALLGLAFIMASACVLNNYIDRHIDKKMARTKQRPLVVGLVDLKNALFFAGALGAIGVLILAFFTNLLTVFVAAIGFFVYVVLYSMWKGHTVYGTAIGSIAGAVPPVVGYCAVSNELDAGAYILFIMMVLWQMPHFFAIALYHYDDYVKAKIPVLPIVGGLWRAKVHMLLYILSFIAVASLLTFAGYTGYGYLAVMSLTSAVWLWLCLKGFTVDDQRKWGRQMFRLSLLVIGAISIAIPLDIA